MSSKKQEKELTYDDRVRVYNNATHDIAMYIDGNRHVILNPGRYQDIKLEDLLAAQQYSHSLFEEGYVYIPWVKARIFLNLDYKGKVIAIKDFPELLKKSHQTWEKEIKGKTLHIRQEFAKYCRKQKGSFTHDQTDAIRRATGYDVTLDY